MNEKLKTNLYKLIELKDYENFLYLISLEKDFDYFSFVSTLEEEDRKILMEKTLLAQENLNITLNKMLFSGFFFKFIKY